MKRLICILIFFCLASNWVVSEGNGDEEGTRATILPQYVHENTDFTDDEYLLAADMCIDPGVNVSFSRTTVKVAVRSEPIRIWVDGNMKLFETDFMSAGSTPEPGDWYGIVLRGRSQMSMSYSSIDHAIVGLDLFKDSYIGLLRYNSFSNNSMAGIKFHNYEHTNGTMYATHDAWIMHSTFKDCGWGIIENGFDTEIENCEFIENDQGGILIGEGSYPFSKGLYIHENTFMDNTNESILIGNNVDQNNGISNIKIEYNTFETTSSVSRYIFSSSPVDDLIIIRNKFYQGHADEAIKLKDCKDTRIRSNYFYDLGTGGDHSFFIDGFENFNATGNQLYRGPGGKLSIRNGHNATFFGNSPGNDGEIICDNVTDLDIHHNSRGKISVSDSNDMRIFNNTRIYNNTISVSLKNNPLDGKNEIYNNQVQDCSGPAIICSGGSSVHIHDNNLTDNEKAIRIIVFKPDSRYLLENNTIFNSTYYDLEAVQGGDYSSKIEIMNSTLDPEKVKSDQEITINACWFMKVRTLDEIGGNLESNMNVIDSTGSYDMDHPINGDWILVQGPFMDFIPSGPDPWDQRSEPVYDKVICGLNLTAENRNWETAVNWSRYLEMDLILDADPVFNDPGIIQFYEDNTSKFNISNLFSDLDPVFIEISESDGKLTFENDTVRSTHPNWYGTSNVTFRAVDSYGNFTDGPVSFVIDPINDPPEILLNITEIDMEEDSTRIIVLSDYMVDVDKDPLEWSFKENENLTISLDNVTWNLTIAPLQDWYGNTTLNLHLSDGNEISKITLPVNVEPVNDAPVFDTPENWNITVYRGTLATIDLQTMVSDMEGDEVKFSINPSSPHITITDGELAILFPESTEDTLFSFQITIDDGNGGTDIASLRIIIDHGTAPATEEWDLYSSTVQVNDEGDWSIEAVGIAGIEVYFIIQDEDGDRTSYKMDEDEQYPGNFSLEIDHDLFDEGEIYTFFFTNSTDGEWLEPEMSGSEVQPGEEEKEVASIWALLLGSILLLILVLVVIIAAVVLISRRSSEGQEFEE